MGFRISGTGWWEYERTAEQGEFFCTKEQSHQTYQIRRVNRWITLFFVPVIPLGTVGKWFRCKSCKSVYSMDALTQAQPALLRECPQCKEQMPRDSSVCPQCGSESPAWTLKDGLWWHRSRAGDWYMLDKKTNEWTKWQEEVSE